MRIAIEILKNSLTNLNNKEKEDVEKAIKLIHSELCNYDQVYTNIYNIEKALSMLENGKTIQNGEGKFSFVAYFKEGKKYFTYHSDDVNKISEISYERIKDHVENYTLETNEYFF